MRQWVAILAVLTACACSRTENTDIVLESSTFRLTIGQDATARSLVLKENGQEMLSKGDAIPLFSVTQERPFNNEVKLENPNTRTTYRANRVRREGDRLIAGFETAAYEAVIRIDEADGYVTFELEDFICDHDRDYEGLRMDVPPVSEMRLLQLPVRERENFGDWLNAMWDGKAAVCVAGCDPYTEIWHTDAGDGRIMTADLYSGIRLRGGRAAIIAAPGKEAFLDAMDRFEQDLDLPRGVRSRRSPLLNRSIYWVSDATPENIDRHIGYAKKAGMEMMLFYYTCFTKGHGYTRLGDYELRDEYTRGLDDIREMMGKLKAAGITPGFHTLQTHIGISSAYVTPVLDHRLGKKRAFTLKSALPASGEVSEIVVEENPVDAPMHDGCRVLGFGGEAFSYESYTTVRPYTFKGARRGHYDTRPAAHAAGEIGGVLDISEFGAKTIYLDQNSDLQDEIADKIAAIYDCGFEFMYLDGSEGVAPPCGINVSLSQYRVIKKLATPPLFTEGAAKSHFGWHMQAGANAFDVFKPDVFEEMILKFPYAEAPRMQKNMTRVDFGWWRIFPETTPEMWDFAEEKAMEYNCPVTIQMNLGSIESNPRMDELFEVLHRWEDIRRQQGSCPQP
ncbi:MAG: hypothetical protein MJZ04_00110 [Bacteroidales bacterium]|nr:hypothetical protein [Bacteroidales bacterium]